MKEMVSNFFYLNAKGPILQVKLRFKNLITKCLKLYSKGDLINEE